MGSTIGSPHLRSGSGPTDFVLDPQVAPVTVIGRPADVRAGFHATVDDRSGSGLLHAGEQWATASFMIFEHTHAVWEWYLQQHGVTHWRGGGRSWTLEPGDLLGVAPGVRHAMASETTASVHFYFAAVDLGTVLTRHRPLRLPGRPYLPRYTIRTRRR